MDLSHFKIEIGVHRNQNIIWIRFNKDQNLINLLKQNLKIRWSASNRCWYALDINFNRKILGLEPKLAGKEVMIKIDNINMVAFKNMQNQLKLMGYSENTIKTYLIEFAQLLYILKKNNVNDLTPEKLKSYFLYCINSLKITENHLHSRLNAIKFYFEKVLKKEKFFFDIPRPKKQKLLPKMMSTRDIKKLFSVVNNPKHTIMLKLCYGMGLRVSEITNLKITDIDSSRMQVLISNAKGKKDRYVPLPETILQDLKDYYNLYKPKDYLFEGQYGGQYSVRSVQSVFKTAMQKAKINKKVGIHGLRHSYATHLLESGADISLIKELLGHNDTKKTKYISKKNP